jgi:predicted transposase/invertase (TIGR01784 family)
MREVSVVREQDDEMRRRLVTFDWALKRLLRSKANFEVLEGFLSVLLRQEVSILEVLESETNKDRSDAKSARVDLKVRLTGGEVVIVEVQASREVDFLQRILFSASRAVTEHIEEGQKYREIPRVISVNILYFRLGHGSDYVYHGTTVFRGLHDGSVLELDPGQEKAAHGSRMETIFPEYYLLKVDEFDENAKDPLDQWLYFLKHQKIPDEFDARGLKRARMVLDVLALSNPDRWDYEDFIKAERIRKGVEESIEIDREVAREEGHAAGHAAGHAEGYQAGREEMIRRLLPRFDDASIAELTSLPIELIARVRESAS